MCATCPAGEVWIVRDVVWIPYADLTFASMDLTGQEFAVWNGLLTWEMQVLADRHIVLNEGDYIHAYSEGGQSVVTICGYSLVA